MIGKNHLDKVEVTEKLSGVQNETINIATKINDKELQQLKKAIKKCNTNAQVDVVIKKHGLDNIEGLPEHIKDLYEKGEINNLKRSDVNNLINQNNYKTIADQAHGISGVNKAIKEYNKITDKSSRSKFAEIMSQSNASLGDYLKGLNGASGGLVGYAGSLAAASLKTIGLSAATMALNAAVSFGTSVLIESLIGGISYLINYEEKQKEAFEKAKQATEENAKAVRSLRSEMSDTSSKASELSSEYATLVQGVDPLTNENESLSTEEYERFLEVSNELAELFPSLTHNYDENGNAILGLSGDVDTVTASIGRLVEQQNNLAKSDMRQHLEDYINGTEDAGGAFEVLEGNKEEVTDAEKELETFKETYDGMINQQGGKYFGQDKIAYNEYLDDVKNKFGKEAYDALSNATVYGNGHGGSNTYAIDFSKLELDDSVKDKITNSYNTFYQDLQTTLTIKQSELETKNKEISDMMMVWVEDIGLYKDEDPAFQRAIETMVGSIQWSDLDIDEGNLDEAKRFIQDIVLNPLANACADPDSKLKITNALSSLFTFDPSELNYKESSEKIKGFLSTIMDAFNAGKPDEEKKTLTDMYDMFHLENYEKTSTEMGNSLAGIATGKSGLLGFDPVEYGKLVNYTKDFTQSQAEAWLAATDGAKSAEEAIRLYQESLNITSFTQLWDSIGTTGNETADKKYLAEKERLEELAAAGKLTEKELKNSSLANVFKEAGTSIEEATEKINNMKSSAEQLASMKTGISSISSILGEKKAGNDIGADTLSGMPDDLKAQTKEYEHFVEVLGDGTSDMDKCRDAANKLATAYVNSNNFLANLTDEKEDYYTSVLDEMGVENAAEVVTNALNRQKIDAKIATFNLKNATQQEINQLGTYISSLDDSRTALGYYTLQQQIANNNALDTSESILNLQKLAEHCGITGEAISLMASLAEDMKTVDYYTTGEGKNDKNAGVIISNANSEIKGDKKRLEKVINKGAKVSTSPKDKPTSPKDSDPTSNEKNKDKSKSTKQIDWISRALDRLSTRLDLVKTKYDNLFNNEKAKDSESLLKLQNKNLDDQYKILSKTEKYQDTAAKKYSKKAEKVKISKNKKEDASLKKAVEDGRIKAKGKESMKKLIAAYGEKKAEKIQEYQDWYDKSQEAKKNKISTQISKRENRIQWYQGFADNADSKRELAQARKENATTATAKNDLIGAEKGYVETSYDYQIKIARMEKDSLKVAQLKAKKKKELRDLDIEIHQNLADQHQSTLDQYSAEKELATKAADRNDLIEQEKTATQALYDEKLAIAGLEDNETEILQLQAEMKKQLRDLQIEQHQNLADEYQAKLDMYSADKDNLDTADKKNGVIDQEKAATQALYAEKIAIAKLEGNTSKEQQLQAELTRQMVVLEKEKLDNIAAYYSNLRKVTELQNKNLSNTADELEARGFIVTSKLYSSQIALNNKQKKNREEELMMLEEAHDKIEQGTQEWYDSLDAIQACKDGISELVKSSIELEKASRNVGWKLFEKLSSRLDLISSEYDLAIKLMSNKKLTDDDTGNFTEEGTATLGAYYSQLVLTQEKAKSMWDNLEKMKKRIDNGEDGYTDPVVLDEYNEKYEEYINLIENEYDIQQNLIDLMKEKYQAELDYLQDLINKRKELLQAEKDAYDYQRSIEEKTKNIGTIQKQMISLSGDDSEGAKTKLQQLQAKLDEANQDLADTEYQQWISDQQKMLDNLYNEYEAFIDDKLNDTGALLQEAITYLNNIDEPVFDTLEKYYKEYGYNPTEDFKNINTALGKDGSIVAAIGEAATTIINHLEQQQKYQGMADDVETEISAIGNVYNDVSAIERFNQAKTSFDQLATAGDNGENIQNYVSSSSASTLDTAGKEIQKIYASVQEVMDAINVVNLDNESDYNETNLQRLEKANRLYENLSTSGKQLLAADWKNTLDYRNLQANHWKGEADRIKREQDALRDRQIDNLTYAIKSTYGKSAVDYATNIQNASTAEIGIATAIQRRRLNRGDGFNSPNNAAIQKIAEMINTSGLGVNINPTADALWEYMQNIGFSHGGIAKTLQKIPAMNGDDGWITVKRGEAVLTPEQTKAFHTLADNLGVLNPSVDLLTAISKRPVASLPENGYSSTQIEGVNFHFELPNVVDSDSFIREMQTNPKVEKVIKTMLWDKNSLSKHRI